MNFRFETVKLIHKDIIFAWLEEPHMMEFWDNSQKHKDDILNFMNGRKEPSDYFDGLFSYWIGFAEGIPHSLIMTHEENEAADTPEPYKSYLSKTGKTFGIDFCIGNKEFFGRGLGAPTLEAFTEFFKLQVEPMVDVFLIDPSENNPRAKHVYEKAGFRHVADFIMGGSGVFAGTPAHLLVKNM